MLFRSLDDIASKCSPQQLVQLQKDLSTQTQQCSAPMPTPSPSDTSAEAKAAAVEAAAVQVAIKMADCQRSITNLSNIVAKIAKILKA